jgi:5-histidylcysteine sulfoxide synthase
MLPITLDVINEEEKREEILKYFYDSYETFERLFTMFRNDDVFYKKSEPTRHPMIFYFGHTAVFFINKLILANIIDTRLNKEFESMFAVGVDEMSWDDLDENNYNWPTVSEVKEYRKSVKNIVSNLILTLPLSKRIKQTDGMWAILMGIEHERIHIETSSVLHRQMPLEFIKKIDYFPICKLDNEIDKNLMVNIEATKLRLGKEREHHLYGWDNEYGIFETEVKEFKVSTYLVSNKEFLEFVEDDGYEKEEFWDDEGKQFLQKTKAKHPVFWIKQQNNGFKYRTLMEEINMPYSWPVDVNYLEAQAFCRWKSHKDSVKYTLPSEEQFYSLYKRAMLDDIPNFDDTKANINLTHFASASPVNMFKFNDIYDVVGNVWQWTRTPIYPFEGFKVDPLYTDFTIPTFDNKHNLIKGGSFISTGNEIMKNSRYAFRRHFYQHAGFRYIVGDKELDIKFFKDYEILENKTSDYNNIVKFINKKIEDKDIV